LEPKVRERRARAQTTLDVPLTLDFQGGVKVARQRSSKSDEVEGLPKAEEPNLAHFPPVDAASMVFLALPLTFFFDVFFFSSPSSSCL